MIRVIKPGMQEFYAFCTHCGCEFAYELSDINLSGTCKCPTCKKDYYHQNRVCPSTRAAEQYGGNRLVVNGSQISLQDFITPCVDCLDTSLTGKKSCSCDENAVCSKCSSSSEAITVLNDGIKDEDATDNSIHCLCRGDIWKTTKCECGLDCCSSSTQTAVNAAITQLDTKVKEYAT
jgi:hypothetical protein